jgi:hypothetical protein
MQIIIKINSIIELILDENQNDMIERLIRIIKPTVEKMSTERLNKITSEAEHNK